MNRGRYGAMRGNCCTLLLKASVEIISFSLKIRNGSITGTFPPLEKVFKIDQYVLALVLGLAYLAANVIL